MDQKIIRDKDQKVLELRIKKFKQKKIAQKQPGPAENKPVHGRGILMSDAGVTDDHDPKACFSGARVEIRLLEVDLLDRS
jgi:hypothetical protein